MMTLDSEIGNATLSLEVLGGSGEICDARVVSVSGTRILAACEAPVAIGAAVKLDSAEKMFLAEVVGLERDENGNRLLMDVRHSLSKPDVQQIVSRLRLSGERSPLSRTRAAGA
jgi:hypothetical protein